MTEHAERHDSTGAADASAQPGSEPHVQGSPESSGQRVTPRPDDLDEALWDGRGIDITPDGPRVGDGW